MSANSLRPHTSQELDILSISNVSELVYCYYHIMKRAHFTEILSSHVSKKKKVTVDYQPYDASCHSQLTKTANQ
jgi:hypothetical protein